MIMPLKKDKNKGFTLLEMMIVLCVASIFMTVVWQVFGNQSATYTRETKYLDMNQNLRAAMYQMSADLRAIGSVGVRVDATGRVDYSLPAPYPDFITAFPDGFSCRFDNTGGQSDGIDNDGDGVTDESEEQFFGDGTVSADEAVVYTFNNNQILRNGVVLAEDIEAIGFGYAYKALNETDRLQKDSSTGEVIWAFDSGTDGRLDRNIDTDGSGVIDTGDAEGGQGLGGTTVIEDIEAVRVWILARTRTPIIGTTDTNTYKVGNYLIGPLNDAYRRRLFDFTVQCRNKVTRNKNPDKA